MSTAAVLIPGIITGLIFATVFYWKFREEENDFEDFVMNCMFALLAFMTGMLWIVSIPVVLIGGLMMGIWHLKTKKTREEDA
jgi:TRAP-type C4-dicarboxylate transport system permease large subunit